jgi:hypothetical protein
MKSFPIGIVYACCRITVQQGGIACGIIGMLKGDICAQGAGHQHQHLRGVPHGHKVLVTIFASGL